MEEENEEKDPEEKIQLFNAQFDLTEEIICILHYMPDPKYPMVSSCRIIYIRVLGHH